MTLVFDTSAFSSLMDGNQQISQSVASLPDARWILPLAVDAEIRYGYANGSREQANLSRYQLFKAQFQVTLVLPDQDTSSQYAELAAWTRKHGFAQSNNDLWIAAASIQLGAKLVTLDKDFSRLPQVRLLESVNN